MSRSAIRTGASCIVEQFGLATIPGWPSRSSGIDLRHDERDGRVHPPGRRVVDDRGAPCRPRRERARARRPRRPRTARCRRPRRPRGRPPRSRGSDRPRTTVRPADRPEASRRSSPTGNSRSLRTWIIVRPTTPVAPTTATVSGWRFIRDMAPLAQSLGRARGEYSSGSPGEPGSRPEGAAGRPAAPRRMTRNGTRTRPDPWPGGAAWPPCGTG